MAKGRIDICMNCKDEREILAHGLCAKCYRRIDREIAAQIDRHSGAINKERQRLFAAHAQLNIVLGKLGVSKADAQSVIGILRPYWAMIAEQLRESGGETKVKSEQKVAAFTVHKPASSVVGEDRENEKADIGRGAGTCGAD